MGGGWGLLPAYVIDATSQDQCLLAGHVVRLGADVTFSIEEQHPQQLTCGIEQMHRDDANRAMPLCSWANGLEGREGGWRPWLCWRTTLSLRPGKANTTQRSRSDLCQPLRAAGAGADQGE